MNEAMKGDDFKESIPFNIFATLKSQMLFLRWPPKEEKKSYNFLNKYLTPQIDSSHALGEARILANNEFLEVLQKNTQRKVEIIFHNRKLLKAFKAKELINFVEYFRNRGVKLSKIIELVERGQLKIYLCKEPYKIHFSLWNGKVVYIQAPHASGKPKEALLFRYKPFVRIFERRYKYLKSKAIPIDRVLVSTSKSLNIARNL
jgi:hypothetical protein